MGVESLKFVWKALSGCGGTEMGLKGFGVYGGPQIGVNGLGWVWRESWN